MQIGLSVVTLLVLSLFLVGCSTTDTSQQDSVVRLPIESQPEPLVLDETDPLVVPNGSAGENLDAFRFHLQQSGAGKPAPDVAEITAALIEAGFDPSTITHTMENTRTGLPAESIFVSIEIQEECLLGQFGESWLEVVVAPKVGNVCIIGDTDRVEAD